MKILVEINLNDIDPNDVYQPKSEWFTSPGYINIPLSKLKMNLNNEVLFKFVKMINEDIPRP